MADKTTTLTTQTGDSIYPNVLDENIPDTIARVSDVNNLKTNVETNYLTKADAETTYQQQAGRADYVSKTYGDSTYATITQLGGKQDKLTAGSNITIEGTTIAATRPENMALYGELAATDEDFTGGTGGGGGGKSVPPTLNLIDWDAGEIRTSITEEEYTNLKNGLYNQVLYTANFDSFFSASDMFMPSKLSVLLQDNEYSFMFAYLSSNEDGEISFISIGSLKVGEKNANNEYPLTVESDGALGLSGTIPIYEATYDSASDKLTLKEAVSGSPNILFVKYTNNNSDSYTWLCFTKTLNISDSFGWQCIDYGRNKVHTIIANNTSIETIDQGLGQTTTLFNKEILVPPSSNVAPILPCTTADNGKVLSVVNGKAQWASAGGGTSIQSVDAYGEGGTTTIEKGKISTDLTGVDLKVPFVLNIYEDSTLSGTPSRIVMTNKVGEIYLGNFDFINHYLMQMTKGTDGNYSYASSIVPNATGNTLFNKPILVPEDLVDPTPILPCTAADNGKVLSVVNGEAQWASAGGGGGSTKLYQHNIILLENSISEYLYIKHISSKQSEVTNIADLNTLLGTGTYTFGCSGEVKINNTWHNAVAIYWDGSYAKSLVMYNVPSEGEKTASLTIYTSVADTVTPV